MNSIRFLSGVPLIVMAGALLILAVQSQLKPRGPAAESLPQMLLDDGQIDAAITWYEALAANGDPAALRGLALASDMAGQSARRATALQRLVRGGSATLEEHVEAARGLAAGGALRDALTTLFNAERRFPAAVDERFLVFYAALARDVGRPDIALPLARRLWKKTGSDDAMRVMLLLGEG